VITAAKFRKDIRVPDLTRSAEMPQALAAERVIAFDQINRGKQKIWNAIPGRGVPSGLECPICDGSARADLPDLPVLPIHREQPLLVFHLEIFWPRRVGQRIATCDKLNLLFPWS
jgi:hypothetical protein